MSEQEEYEAIKHLIPNVEDEEGEVILNMQEVFSHMARQSHVVVPRNREFNRKKVVEAFTAAFELIGGVPRLATWAHAHPTEFYKLYSKLLPSTQQHDFGNDGVLKIIHSIAPGPLDVPKSPSPAIEGEYSEVNESHGR